MNANKRVFLFIFCCLSLYLLFSYINFAYKIRWEPFDRVNLLADVIQEEQSELTPQDNKLTQVDDTLRRMDTLAGVNQSTSVSIEQTADTVNSVKEAQIPFDKRANRFIKQKDIIGFDSITTGAVLKHLADKLAKIKQGKKVKIRIAYLGDSMIEGDLLSQTLRTWMQRTYGGHGVGFVPITSQVAKFRQTATASFSSGWKDLNFRTRRSPYHYLSGHTFFSSGDDWVNIRDNTINDTVGNLSKYLLYGSVPDSSTAMVTLSETQLALKGKGLFNRKLLAYDKSRSIKVLVSDTLLPLYGISFESENGVIVDNFSFRGIAGMEYARLSRNFLEAIQTKNAYDLIIFQYGVNVMYKPDDVHFSWYRKAIAPVIKKMKDCFPEADFLIVGTADRAFRYPDGYQSALGIEELLKEQVRLAWQTKSAFYSLYAAMGGENSMVNWATQTPSLANKDYVHPNALGARILGKDLFEAIVKDAKKAQGNSIREENK